MDSANLVAMYSVNGQPGEWNFFEHDFTNHIPPLYGAGIQALAKKFSSHTDFIQEVGLSEFANFQEDGTEDGPIFPFKIVFEPAPDIAKKYSNTKPNNAMDYITQLTNIPANSTLYNIYGYTAPIQYGGDKLLIGSLVLDGSMVTSRFGDQQLYFRHQDMAEDLVIRKEWIPYC